MESRPQYTPENITELPEGSVFVFGSNLAGNHAGGAARVAVERFGAVEGVGQGLRGQSYAFPTLGVKLQQFSVELLELARDGFYMTCIHHPELTFYLTQVGTGIAGYSKEDMKSLFKVKLSNVIYPEGW